MLVAIADVDAAVAEGTRRSIAMPRSNTTSVYTPAVIFPMLPERLSTDLTSLERPAGSARRSSSSSSSRRTATLTASDVYGALVRNHAKLAYNAVGAWLAGSGPLPPAAAAVPGMDEQLRMQDRVGAGAAAACAHEHGALDFETIEVAADVRRRHAAASCGRRRRTARRQLIENLMVAANGVTARFLDAHGVSVAAPRREVARALGSHSRAGRSSSATTLPAAADARALERRFWRGARRPIPTRFPICR